MLLSRSVSPANRPRASVVFHRPLESAAYVPGSNHKTAGCVPYLQENAIVVLDLPVDHFPIYRTRSPNSCSSVMATKIRHVDRDAGKLRRRTISTDRPYACVVFIELNPRIHEIVPAWRGVTTSSFKHDDGSMFVKKLGSLRRSRMPPGLCLFRIR